jgi:hypothetical protein
VASSSTNFEQQLARGKVTERQIAEYLKALGFYVLPTTDFAARGAPMFEAQERERSLVMPDLQAFGDGIGAWWESKLKSQATQTDWLDGRRVNRLVTGIDVEAWNRYCRVERETKMPVAIVLVHEHEQEVRCGTLAQLAEVESHQSARMGRGGMIFWAYEAVPLWMPLAELKANIDAQRYSARLVEPIKPPVVHGLLKQGHALRRHGINREDAPKEEISAKPPWTWACLVCNETWNGEKAHVCPPNAGTWRRDFWIARIIWVLSDMPRDEIAAIVDRPIARADLARMLGNRWQPQGDVL